MRTQRDSSFDLNNLPSSDDDVDVGDVGRGEEARDAHVQREGEDAITMMIRSSSRDTIAIDLNVYPNEEFEAPLLDVHVPQFQNDVDVDSAVDVGGEDGDTHTERECNNALPTVIRSSSREMLEIDLNVDPNEEFEAPLLGVNESQLQEDDDCDGNSYYDSNVDYLETSNSGMSPQQSQAPRRIKFISNEDRWKIYSALLARSVDEKLKHGITIKEVSEMFSVPLRTVQGIWKRAKDTPHGEIVDVSHRRTKRCGRKKICIGIDQVKAILLQHRTTIRSAALALGVSPSTLHRHLKEGDIRRHSNAIKPLLREQNKLARLKFCISMLEPNSIHHEPKFSDMYNVVHIDEKWFYMTKKSETFYLHHDEEEPLRTCQSKNFIGKVMFLVAMARPRFDDNGNEVFSGKIGVFPFVTIQAAQRRSRNREVGTLEMKPMTSVKKETIRAYLIEKVIPAIQAKWPVEDSRKPIFIQQDNARTHITSGDEEFQRAATKNGFDIQIVCQPPNSPDLNVLDLGFFKVIQSLQHKECPRSIEELVNVVQKSFDDYSTTMVNRVFLTLQSCMIEIMKVGGSNKYKIPHDKKEALEREGRLPKQMTCEYSLVHRIMNILA